MTRMKRPSPSENIDLSKKTARRTKDAALISGAVSTLGPTFLLCTSHQRVLARIYN